MRLSLLAGLLIGLTVLAACREDPDVLTVVVTEVVEVEGDMIMVTRVVRQQVEVIITPTRSQQGPARPVTLDLRFSGRVNRLDPQRRLEQDGQDLVQNLFAGLTNHNPETNQIEPELAASWQVDETGRRWRFNLRDDIFWVWRDPGDLDRLALIRPVTADDVVFALERACDPTTQTPDAFVLYVIEGCEAVNRQAEPPTGDAGQIGARALDDVTLEIRLSRPAAYFLTLTSLPVFYPVPREHVGSLGPGWESEATLWTSGPFTLSPRSLGGARTVLQRNPTWPLPIAGNVDEVHILYLNEDQDAFALWQDKQLDLAPLPLAEKAPLERRSPQRVQLVPGQQVFYLAYDFNSPVFREVEVRRAFGAAIDRQRLIDEVYAGRGQPMRHLAPPGTIGAPPLDEVGTGYDPDFARQQMAASTYRSCRLMPPIVFMTGPSDRQLQQAELMRRMWIEELDCLEEQIAIRQVQFGELLVYTRPRDAERPDIWDLGWAPYFPDEHNWLSELLHCQDSENRPERPCREVDDLLREAAVTVDPARRATVYREIERRFFASGGLEPLTPLFVRGQFVAQQLWLRYVPAHFGGAQYDRYVINAQEKDLERGR